MVKLLRGVWRWLTSRAVRQAVDQHRIVRRLLAFQRDRLSVEAASELEAGLDELARRLHRVDPVPEIAAARAELERAGHLWLQGMQRRAVPELIEILIVASVLILGVRTFFLQPMTIPTGSMQPTLYGITTENVRRQPQVQFPGLAGRALEQVLYGRRYLEILARADGELTAVSPVEPAIPWLRGVSWLRKLDFQVGPESYRIWNPPTELAEVPPWPADHAILGHARLRPRRLYRAGEALVRLILTSGDHVLVDRLSYNFRPPRRGDIVVFRTTGIPGIQEGTHYMKRLVAVGGERVRIGDDRHLVVNGTRLDHRTPGFEQVYSFNGPAREGEYAGHLNDAVAQSYRMPAGSLAPRFPNERTEFAVRPGHCLVMGDNTVGSLDGRRWGDFPQEHIVGRYWMVYWPLSPRFGWVAR